MNKEIKSIIEDLLKPISKKLEDLPTKEDFNNLSMGLCQKISHVERKVEQVENDLDDVQQYLRRYDLRIFKVPVTVIANKDITDWSLEYFTQELGVNIDERDIDRAHRIGKEKDGKVQIIIRFCSWNPRCMVYRNRKKGKYPIALDLTKRNLDFFQDAKKLLELHQAKAQYAFVDINCKIGVKLCDDTLFFPRSIAELKNKMDI